MISLHNQMYIQDYDDIPIRMVGTKILEIGVNEERLLQSHLKDKILSANYLGIDIEPREGKLNIIQADILEYDLIENYDTIIMISVLEHIELCDWKNLIQKLKDRLTPGGYLIIATPYKQKLRDYVYSSSYRGSKEQVHTIFGIDHKVLAKYFPQAKTKIVRRIWWRQDGTNYIRASLRFLKRLFFGENPIKKNIMVFWKKPIHKCSECGWFPKKEKPCVYPRELITRAFGCSLLK